MRAARLAVATHEEDAQEAAVHTREFKLAQQDILMVQLQTRHITEEASQAKHEERLRMRAKIEALRKQVEQRPLEEERATSRQQLQAS